MSDELDERIARIGRHPFRAKFHLRPHERGFVALRGMPAVREHARDLLLKKIGAAHPVKDGRQTPYRGHPVFLAQHATATCCRACLEKWHGIQKGRELTEAELGYAVEVVMRWIEREAATDRRRSG